MGIRESTNRNLEFVCPSLTLSFYYNLLLDDGVSLMGFALGFVEMGPLLMVFQLPMILMFFELLFVWFDMNEN